MSTLYITTFNDDLYYKSGKRMLESFRRHQPVSNMLIAYEQNPPEVHSVYDYSFFLFDRKYGIVEAWTNANHDIIDITYGGSKVYDPNDKLTSWNRQAARWFRKIAALHYAVNELPQFDYYVFLDCDCEILKHIPNSLIEGLLKKSDAFYHYGKHRYATDTGIESGVIGFTKRSYLLNECFNMYLTGRFRKERRWDDGFIFSRIVKDYPNCGIDVIADIYAPDGECIKHGPFAEYIRHDKGKHTR